MQAYENDLLTEMILQVGFQKPDFYPSLTGKSDDLSEMVVLVAAK